MNAARLKELREQKGLTQEELAQVVGSSQRQISKYENGIQQPTSPVISSLADALNTTADYLLGKTDDPAVPLKGDLSAMEKHAVELIRHASPDKRKEMLRVLEAMSQ
jgi:transcriptional regulator with XRE-family HTH domain